MNRQLKFRIIHGSETDKRFTFLNLEKDIFDIKQYINPQINQFTGFTDSFGQEIYEGDIISFVGNSISKFHVHFENAEFMVKAEEGFFSIVTEINLSKFLLLEKENIQKKVVGNIFQDETKK